MEKYIAVRTESLYQFWFTLFNLYQFTLIISPKTNNCVMTVSFAIDSPSFLCASQF